MFIAGGSLLTRIAESEAIPASGLIDQSGISVEAARFCPLDRAVKTPIHAHQSMPYIGLARALRLLS